MNTVHGAGLAKDRKRCLYCDAAFNMFDELGKHSKQSHQHYFCDIFFAGLISECPGTHGKADKAPDIFITKIIDPKLEKGMQVIQTPEPDPFANKWYPALSQVKWDDNNKIKCEVCHRYHKSSKWRVEHVKHFHPMVSYECKFCTELVFYTIQDLVKHCKKTHVSCNNCDSFHRDDESLQSHISHQNQPVPPQQPQAQPADIQPVLPVAHHWEQTPRRKKQTCRRLMTRQRMQVQWVKQTFALLIQVTHVVSVRYSAQLGLVIRIIWALIKRFHVHSVHRNFSTPAAEINTSSRGTRTAQVDQTMFLAVYHPTVGRNFLLWRKWGSMWGATTDSSYRGGGHTGVVLTVSFWFQVCYSRVPPMVWNCGMTHQPPPPR